MPATFVLALCLPVCTIENLVLLYRSPVDLPRRQLAVKEIHPVARAGPRRRRAAGRRLVGRRLVGGRRHGQRGVARRGAHAAAAAAVARVERPARGTAGLGPSWRNMTPSSLMSTSPPPSRSKVEKVWWNLASSFSASIEV